MTDQDNIPEEAEEAMVAGRARAAMRGEDHNPDGHVVFRMYDATFVEVATPHNMGRSTMTIASGTSRENDPKEIRCSCGKWFSSTRDAHAHLLDAQGEVREA